MILVAKLPVYLKVEALAVKVPAILKGVPEPDKTQVSSPASKV